MPAAREARRVGTTLVVGAGALLVVLAIAALTAPRTPGRGRRRLDGRDRGRRSSTTVAPTTVPAGGAASTVAVRGRGGPPPDPDLQIIPTGVPPHTADDVQPLNDPTVSRPDPVRQADVVVAPALPGRDQLARRPAGRPRRHVDVWLVTVQGEVRDDLVGQPEVLQAWSVDGGGVIVSLQIAGHPDVRVVAGLRASGGGTWIRLPDGAQVARGARRRLRPLPGERPRRARSSRPTR